MADNRYSTYANQVQTEFRDLFNMAPVAPTPLRAMAQELAIQPGGNTFREYITPFVRGTSTTLSAVRALTSNNPLTTNPSYAGQISSIEENIGYKNHTIEDAFTFGRDIELTAGIDTLYNQPDQLAARLKKQFDESYAQWAHEKCLAQAVYSNEWILDDDSTVSLTAAVSSSDTTFDISDAEKTSSGIAVGDIVKVGNKRRPSDNSSAVETIDVALVKTVGADGSGAGTNNSQITIEATAANFPASDSFDGDGKQGKAFEKLVTSLAAHASGARVQIDRPQALTVTNVDYILSKIKTSKLKANLAGGEFVVYMTPEVDEVLFGTNASGVRTPVVANDFLGKEVLFNGELEKYRGMYTMVDSNALSRTEASSGSDLTTRRHYIWAFVKGQTFGFGEPLKGGGTMDSIVGTDNKLMKFTYLEVSGAVTLYMGSLKGFLIPVTV